MLNGRVIGPFSKEQLFDLKAKGHVKGNEEAQVFPTGAWIPVSELDIYGEMMDEARVIVNNEVFEKTFTIDINELRSLMKQKEVDSEDVPSLHPIESLTETIRIPNSTPIKKVEPKPKPVEIILDEALEKEFYQSQNVAGLDEKTVINPVAQQEIEKLRRQQRQALVEQAALDAEHEKQHALQKRLEDDEANLIALENIPSDALTQVVQLKNFSLGILQAASEEEVLIDKQKKAYDLKKKQEAEEAEEENEEEKPVESNKKIRLVLIIGGFALLYAFLFPNEDKPKIPPFQNLPPQIIFPIPFDVLDKQTSALEYDKGIQRTLGGTYPEIVKAGLHFKASFENDINNLNAVNFLVRTYGEELYYSKKLMEDAHTIFNIIQSKRPFLMQDPNGVMGLNLFYSSINKHEAAADVISRYLKLNSKNVTQELFAVYLHSLMKVGKIDLAKQFYVALDKAEKKNSYALESLIEHARLNQEEDRALKYADEAIKKYPNLVKFYLIKAEILLKKKDLKPIEPLLAEVTKRNIEYNDRMRAKFLEVSGIYTAMKGKVKEATVLLTKSLELSDSAELRMKLADLATSDSTSPAADKLIQQSRATKLLYEARDFYDKKSYVNALSSAAKASDLVPSYIPAELFLAKIQLKLGLSKQGLKTLEDLIAKFPEDKDINIALINAYIDTFKFKQAQSRIAIISATGFRNTWEYASANAKLFLKMGDILHALGWLKTSIRLNPLNDHDIFSLAEIQLKRSDFASVRDLLNKCTELDPINPDYRIAYAKMVYETQDDQAAIGYLLGLQGDFGENPKFLGEMAIFYFRAGKVKDFQAYKKKLEQLPSKDKALYEFLIRAALLDERYNEIPELVEKLIEIEPGDLESMMTAGKVLFESEKLVEAAKWFERVRLKLPSYPKVQYYVARIKFLIGEYDEAMKEVEHDIADNGESDTSLVFIGDIYVQKKDLLKAETYYKKAQKINPRSYEALMGMAEISIIRNDFELALDLFKRALKERTDEPVIHRKIGDVYRLLGQGTLAIESYKMYLEMNPEASDKKTIEDYIQLLQ
jgi:predicted Zn-dependent protease